MAHRHHHIGISVLFLLAYVVSISSFVAAEAADINMDILPTTRLDMIPSLRLEQGWNSNIFNTRTGETSDFFFRARPELALRWNTPGAGVRLAGSVEETWYYSNAGANQEPTWNVTLGLTGGDAVQINPTVAVVPSVYYLNTINSARRAQLLPAGDAVLPQASIATYTNTRSNDFGGGLGLIYLATPNLNFGLNGNYGERRFGGDNNAGLTSSSTTGGGASVSYLVSPAFSFGVGVSGSRNAFENKPGADTFFAGVHFGYQFTPVFRVGGQVGESYVKEGTATGGAERHSSSLSGNIDASYATKYFSTHVYASSNFSGASGYGGITRQDTAGLGFSDQFARDWFWNLSAAYQRSKSVFVSDAVNLHTTYGAGGLRFKPYEWASLDLNGNVNRQTSSGQFGSALNSYSAVLGITIGKPFNIY